MKKKEKYVSPAILKIDVIERTVAAGPPEINSATETEANERMSKAMDLTKAKAKKCEDNDL